MRYFIRIRFKGSLYHGWQIQQNALSVQQLVNEALSKVLHQQIETVGCGRTDTGVHASDFYAHFDVLKKLENIQAIPGKLASLKVRDIDFREIIPVADDAHARFDATSRTYEYRVIRERNPFLMDYAHYLYGRLDVDKMNSVSETLIGRKDFGAFSKTGTQVKTNICHITEARWFESQEQLIFRIQADRFLRNMVRAIVGTLLEIGQGKRAPENMLQVIESKSRSKAGMSVPACGLFLTEVKYPYPLSSEPSRNE